MGRLGIGGIGQRQARAAGIVFFGAAALGVQVPNVFGADAGNVHAVEAGGFKTIERRVERTDGALHVFHTLVDQGVAAYALAHFFERAPMRHQLVARGHVDAIHIGVHHRRRGAGHIDLGGTGFARHLHDFAAGGAAHDRVIDQQHAPALELAADHIELLPHRFFAHRLPRHDESAPHVAVFYEAFAVGFAEQMRQLGRGRSARFGDRDHHIDLVQRHLQPQALGQGVAHIEPCLIDRDAVDRGVGPGQIDVLEHAGVAARLGGALARLDLAIEPDEHRLAGGDVAQKIVAGAFERHRLAGHHDGAVFAAPHAQRPNAEGIAKGQQAVAGDECNHGIRAAQAQVRGCHCGKQGLGAPGTVLAGAADLVRQHVEQHLGVAVGVDVAVVALNHVAPQGLRVGQVAIVRHHDAKGRVDVKGLRLFLAVGVAGRGVAHLPQAVVARQGAHIARAKDIAHHALGLVHEELALLLGDDAGRILAAVLQQQQGVIEQLIDRCRAGNAYDSTHTTSPVLFKENGLPATLASGLRAPLGQRRAKRPRPTAPMPGAGAAASGAAPG